MSTIYVICKVGYQYNDECFDQKEAASPVEAFVSRDEADWECDKKNMAKARSMQWPQNLSLYNQDVFNEFGYEFAIPKEWDDDKVLQFLKKYGLFFYVVQEVVLNG